VHSLAITVGVKPLQWHDIIRELLSSLQYDPALSGEVSVEDQVANGLTEKGVNKVKSLLGELPNLQTVLKSLESDGNECKGNCKDFRMINEKIVGLNENVSVSVPEGLEVSRDGDKASLATEGGRFVGPVHMADLFEWISRRESFYIREMVGIDNHETRVALAKRLVSKGLLLVGEVD
jgi:hypothetical protein